MLPRRWVVERTFAWLGQAAGGFPKITKSVPASSLAFIQVRDDRLDGAETGTEMIFLYSL